MKPRDKTRRHLPAWRRWLRRLLVSTVALAVCSWLALYSYGRFADRALGPPSQAFAPRADDTALDRAIAPMLAARAGESGMVLIEDNLQAYAIRARSARQAERSLDVMYYIWRADETGRQLLRDLGDAAQRGARVRMLLDDNNQRGMDDLLLALDKHPNLEVRLFNPGRNRRGYLGRGLELLLRPVSLNRRMHNKAWIADNRVAIVGGRNIGDEYFDGSEHVNFADADLLLIGPAVEQTSAVFDSYWNSRAVIPIKALASADVAAPDHRDTRIGDTRPAGPYRRALDEAVASMDHWLSTHPAHWSANVQVITDPPEKALPHEATSDRQSLLIQKLAAAMNSVARELTIVSPYFVPGEAGSQWLIRLAERPVSVHVLTNSLAATDVALVHAGYSAYRQQLLRAGVDLRELVPDRSGHALSWLGSSSASLHTKAFVVDDRIGFVGSFNFDPRSTWLNTEMGVLFEQAELATQLHDIYGRTLEPGASFDLFLDQGKLRWRDQRNGVDIAWTHDPDSSWLLRALIAAARLLPIESQL